MGSIADIFRTGIEGLLTPFDYLGPFWGLTLLSLLSGVGMLWVVGKTTPQTRVERARAQMDASVYEIRLFLDSPRRVAISLGRLIGNSLLYIAYMLPAFVILALPLGLMYLSLETRHGMEALPAKAPVVVEVQLETGNEEGRSLEVTASEGLRVTAPVMFAPSEGRAFVRVQADTAAIHALELKLGETSTSKQLVFDSAALQMAPERSSGLDRFLTYGPESGLSAPFEAIRVNHEGRDASYLGISMPWWLWWLLLMMVSAFGLRKQLGVAL